MRNTIPERVEIICDVCGKKFDAYDSKLCGSMQMRRNALDHLGNPVANDDVVFDTCTSCHQKIADFINALKLSSHTHVDTGDTRKRQPI